MKRDEQSIRQRELAARIGREFCSCDRLIPLGPHGSFTCSTPLRDRDRLWTARRIDDIAFRAIGARMLDCDGGCIDHAWRGGYDDNVREPWFLVTEPYLSDVQATQLAARIQKRLGDWYIQAIALPTIDGAWKPGSCAPIVVVARDCRTILAAARWALN